MKKIFPFILNLIPRKFLISLSYLVKPFISYFYKGSKYQCPVCEKTFRKLMPYGYNRVRQNALCPSCLSLERHRLMWLFLQNKTGFFNENIKLLHIAPEQCFYKRFRKMKNIEYTTADMDSPIADVRLDVQEMPFSEASFNMVFCNHVLEHVDDDAKAMREIYRVLKPGGMAILHVPIDYSREKTYEDARITAPKEREKHFLQHDHVRLYGNDYPERLKQAGFVVKDTNYFDQLNDSMRDKFRITTRELMIGFYKE